MTHLVEQKSSRPLGGVGRFERPMEPFSDEDETGADDGEQQECTQMRAGLHVPIQECGNEQSAEGNCKETGPTVKQERGSDHGKDEEEEAVGTAEVSQGEAAAVGQKYEEGSHTISNGDRLWAGEIPQQGFQAISSRLAHIAIQSG